MFLFAIKPYLQTVKCQTASQSDFFGRADSAIVDGVQIRLPRFRVFAFIPILTSNLSASLWLILLLSIPLDFVEASSQKANLDCERTLYDEETRAGARFLSEQGRDLHTSTAIERAVKWVKARIPGPYQKPADRISAWVTYLDLMYKYSLRHPRMKEDLRKILHNMFVIKPEDIPHSHFQLQVRIARERGQGTLQITDEMREKESAKIIKEQKESLDVWINYFLSNDSNIYPMWTKYWVMTRMVQISQLNPLDGTFQKRSKNTVTPFAELNHEAVEAVIRVIQKKARGNLNQVEDEDMRNLVDQGNFGKMYSHAFKRSLENMGDLSVTKGEWRKFNQGSDPRILSDSLRGQGTGWCTAGIETARTQLAAGDFYVYYTMDKNNNPTMPRLAIRMEGTRIAEVRGIAKDQNVDPIIGSTDVLDQKLATFGEEGKKYKKRLSDMTQLNAIKKKHKVGIDLTQPELRFLYQLDSKIEGFGYQSPEQIKEIIVERDFKTDLSKAFNADRDLVTDNKADILSGKSSYFWGDYKHEPHDDLSKSKLIYISGNADFELLSDARYLSSLAHIGGNAYFQSLKDATGLNSLASIGGGAHFISLTDSKGLKALSHIGGYVSFWRLTDASGLSALAYIGDFAEFNDLRDAKGLSALAYIGGNAYFESLKDATGLGTLSFIGGDVDLNFLEDASGLTSLSHVGLSAKFIRLKNSKGLSSLAHVGNNALFGSLTDARSLRALSYIGGGAFFDSLVDSKGLNSLAKIGGFAIFDSLTDARGLTSLRYIGGGVGEPEFPKLFGTRWVSDSNGYGSFRKMN